MKAILLVDDDEMTQTLVAYILSQAKDIEIFPAYNTKEADTVLKNHTVDLILLDIFLPGKDGLVYSLELKVNAETKDIPIVFLTGSESDTNKEAAFGMGAVGYIIKPSNEDEMESFKNQVEKLLTGRNP